ncbi:MAG: TylF/MycF family methyltransferase [Actinomycetota bacterium]|nr:TylF/MycF family methyltransferase [Actinomycetota bacterium]
MERRWRSAAWKREHPLSLGDRARGLARAPLVSAVRAVRRVAAGRPLSYLDLAATFTATRSIEGDYCEFGVYTGRSFVRAYRAIRAAERKSKGPPRRMFAFDSFEGLPQPGTLDSTYPHFRQGSLSATEEEFRANLRRHGVELDRVRVVPGWYDQVLSPGLAERDGLESVAFALVDCDLYESAVPVLEFLTPLLSDGAVLVFDDWYLFRANPRLGVQRAFHEWREKESDLGVSEFPWVPGSFQRAFIVHRPVPDGSVQGPERTEA